MKNTMTSFDIKAIIDELKETIQGKKIRNIYRLDDKLFLFRLTPGPIDFIVELEKRIHTTKYKLDTPVKPPSFCMELRKHLRNGQIKEIGQYEFERIVLIDVETKTESKHLVAEIFKRGNMILLNDAQRIITAFYFAELKDRKIFRGKAIKYPPSTGIHPTLLTLEDLKKAIKKNPSSKIEKTLTQIIPYPLTYLREALHEAKVDKEAVSPLEEGELLKILTAIKRVFDKHTVTGYTPCIVQDTYGNPIDVTPIPLKIYTGNPLQQFNTFNEAADEYFKEHYLNSMQSSKTNMFEVEEERLKRIVKKQKDEEENVRKKIRECKLAAEALKEHAYQLGILLKFLHDNWGNKESINNIKASPLLSSNQIVKSLLQVDLKNKRISLFFNEVTFWIDITISPFKSASNYHDKAKRLETKLQRLQKLQLEGKETLKTYVSGIKQQPQTTIQERKERKWYEKFRWFLSSENILVLSGKDASTNQILITRHLDPDDIVFHAEIHGAPFTIVKMKKEKPCEATIQEAAVATASYSKAWREKIAALDVYWIKPDQVSKKPPSGEYLKKGMYMIYGRRNYVKHVNLTLAIGINTYDGKIMIIGGPPKSIEKWSRIYVELTPGYESSGRIAKEIKKILIKRLGDEFTLSIKSLDVGEIQRFLPPGKSRLINIKKGKDEKISIDNIQMKG